MTFTDGIIEAADDQGRLYGRERLKQFMIDNVALTPAEFLEKLRLNLERNFNNADYLDDTTAVFVQVDCPGGRT
jgi:serine phosphatase RsbU (regulator of sigma subunit)